MDLATYVLQQLETVNGRLRSVVSDVSREEWEWAPGPGLNPLGFDAWHVAAIQDWAINTWMRNLPTVRSRPEWDAKGMNASFLPFGMPLETTFEVARATNPQDVVAYADAVLKEVIAFIGGLEPGQFDALPDNRAHLADSRYDVPDYMEEIGGMYEQRYWRVLAGACTAHCNRHIGELELMLAILRTS